MSLEHPAVSVAFPTKHTLSLNGAVTLPAQLPGRACTWQLFRGKSGPTTNDAQGQKQGLPACMDFKFSPRIISPSSISGVCSEHSATLPFVGTVWYPISKSYFTDTNVRAGSSGESGQSIEWQPFCYGRSQRISGGKAKLLARLRNWNGRCCKRCFGSILEPCLGFWELARWMVLLKASSLRYVLALSQL